MARVSVIIPVYNGAATIGLALESVFAQTFTDYEIVAVNDGSTDETASVLASYGDRIRVVTQHNRGLSAARNAGVRASSGEYLAFIDDDDEWMLEKLARCVSVLDQNPDCVLAYSGAVRIDLSGAPIPIQNVQNDGVESPTMAQMLARPWNVVPCQFVVRRDVFERCGGFDERFVSTCEDLYFLLLAREYGYFSGIPEPLVRKTTRPLYPKALNREPQCDLFRRLVSERYGSSATGLIREFRQMRVKVMKHTARILIKEGRSKDARRCLARVIYYQPTSPKAYRRYLQTFLPTRMPRAASSTEDSEA
jgi:glycosyltransferase involved in cell wall biosynthesis